MRRLNIQKLMCAASALVAIVTLSSAEAMAKGGRPAEPRQANQRLDERRATSHVTYGRAVIFRAGHLPQLAPKEVSPHKTHPTQRPRPTHYLDTALPIIIQGAPHELVLRRHMHTG